MPIENPSLVKNFRTIDEEIEYIFEQYPQAQWTAKDAEPLAFPVTKVEEGGGNRIVVRERPYRDGAKLDDTGSSPKEWILTACFFVGHNEPNIDTINGGLPLYPDVLNALIESFNIHETGDLVVPTRGTVRARCQSYRRAEAQEQRNFAALDLTFIEDNEDNVDAQSFTAPSASGSAGLVAEQAEFSEQSEGMWGGGIQDLNQLTAQLEGLANAPGQYAQDLETVSKTVMNNVDRVVEAHTNAAKEGRNILSGAESTKVQRDLQKIKELAGKVRHAPRQGQQKIITKKYDQQLSIFQISNIEGVSVQILIENNPQIENLFIIPAGTPVRMFADASPQG